MIVVSDSGPLISLLKAEELNILHTLYGEVLIPEAVFAELTTNSRYVDEANQIQNSTFIHVVSVNDRKSVSLLQRATGLDLGESEAIVYADGNNADVLLIEEEAGRKVAQHMQLRVRGSIGILLYAFDKEIITRADVEKALEKMRLSERRISEHLYQYAYEHINSGEE